jgi:hypothetical protein
MDNVQNCGSYVCILFGSYNEFNISVHHRYHHCCRYHHHIITTKAIIVEQNDLF